MKILNITIIGIGCLFVSACATQSGWVPTVDTYNNRQNYRLDQDMYDCRQLASQASQGTAKETAIGAGVGGLIGAAGGAALGAIFGNPGTGAAIGAAAGGIGGASKQGLQAENTYKRAYKSCLRQRGHTVID